MIRTFWQKYKKIIALFFAVKIAFFALILATYPLIPFSEYDYAINGYHYEKAGDPLSRSLAAYDGQWYLHIAQNGYSNFSTELEQKKSYAFFPLYPLLIAMFMPLFGGSPLAAALTISFVGALASVILLYAIASMEMPSAAAKRSVWYFLIFPSSIFFSVAYTEALFFALSLASILCVRRGRFATAGLWAYLAALARPQGVLLFFPLAIEWWQQHGRRPLNRSALKNLLSASAAPLGFATYYAYLVFITGNPFVYFQSNAQSWGRQLGSLFDAAMLIGDRLQRFAEIPFHSFQYSQLDLVAMILFLGMSIVIVQRFRLSYAVYSILLVVFPLLTGSTMSMIRYVALSFPHFLLLGQIGTRSKAMNAAITLISLWLTIQLWIRFVHWYWAG